MKSVLVISVGWLLWFVKISLAVFQVFFGDSNTGLMQRADAVCKSYGCCNIVATCGLLQDTRQ